MGIKLKHAGTISGGSGRSKNGPQMSDASRVDTGGHIVTAQAVVGRTSAHPGAGGGGGGHAPLVSAPHGASMISAPPVSGGSARGGGGGVRVGGKGKGASATANGGKGGIKSFRATTGYGPQVPDPDFWVTGYDPKVRPDKYSVWNPQTQQWERGKVAYQNWLGGMGDERRGDLAEAADERKFTEAQRREAEQLNAVYERARKSGRYTPEELAQIRTQVENRKAGIQPLSQLPQPSAQDRFNDSIVTDSASGNRYFQDANGKLVPLQNGGVTPEMWNKWYEYESKVKAYDKDADGNLVPRDRTPDEIQAAIEAREAQFTKRFGPQQPEPGVTDATGSSRGTGTITTADGRTVSTSDLKRGTISITQNGKTTTTTVDDIMRDPKMIENLKEHWAVGAGMNPESKQTPKSTSPAPASSVPSDPTLPSVEPGEMGGGEGRPQPRRGLILMDQGRNVSLPQPEASGREEPSKPRRGLILLDQGKNVPLPQSEAAPAGETPLQAPVPEPADGSSEEIAEVVEEAPPPKKEKKDDE